MMALTQTLTLMAERASSTWTTLASLAAPTASCLVNTLRWQPPRAGGPSRVSSGGGGRSRWERLRRSKMDDDQDLLLIRCGTSSLTTSSIPSQRRRTNYHLCCGGGKDFWTCLRAQMTWGQDWARPERLWRWNTSRSGAAQLCSGQIQNYLTSLFSYFS